MSAAAHIPVLLAETMAALDVHAGGLYVDATLGLGGHAEALLERGARVLALDRDADSIARARARLARYEAEGRFRAVHSDYRRILAVLATEGEGPVDGLLADLGISSAQLDDPERGFSFSHDGPLDMRLDRAPDVPTAADIVAGAGEGDLVRILRDLGEEPDARRIARAIVRRRAEAPFLRTADLATVVRAAKRRPRGPVRIDPATLTFQALRIAVNHEIEGLEAFVDDAVKALKPGARLAIIAFHSLEDRPVKTALHRLARGCDCPPGLPLCACGKEPVVRLLPRKAIRASAAEQAANPRSRSARLRVAEKLERQAAA